MAATPGNQFWKLRSKHGRDKIFSDPKILWEASCEFFQWCEDNPLKEAQIKVIAIGNGLGSQTKKVKVDKMRAFTWAGLELFLGVGSFKHYKTEEQYKDFWKVIDDIEAVMYSQKFTGAAAGLLDSRIISRELGLADKKEVENKGGQVITIERNIVTRDESKP